MNTMRAPKPMTHPRHFAIQTRDKTTYIQSLDPIEFKKHTLLGAI